MSGRRYSSGYDHRSGGTSQIQNVAPADDLVAVFMPTHLMPPSGFTVFVPRAKVMLVDMSVEDAAKIILSAGMVTPDSQARLKALADAAKRPAKEQAAIGEAAPSTVPENQSNKGPTAIGKNRRERRSQIAGR